MKSIGLDIGVSSVGWSIIETETGAILETGVRLFSEGNADNNIERRGNRQGRRLIRRRKNRLSEMSILLKKESLQFKREHHKNPYELRVKGLKEKLTEEELGIALYHLAKHRGISYDLKDVEDDTGNQSDYQLILDKNQLLLKEKTPSEIQLDRLHKLGKVRTDLESIEPILNVFPTKSYEYEARKLLECQKEKGHIFTEDFVEEYLSILTRKREYYVGPGNEKSRTNYGIYREDGTTLDNLFEILIGKDKIYPNELRAAGSSYTAQEFNLLNDLNNLRIDGTEDGKLSPEHKREILKELKTSNKNITMLNLISKITGSSKDGIKGYRINSKDKPDIHSMSNYRKVRKKIKSRSKEMDLIEVDTNDWPVELYDQLAHILTLNTDNGEIRRSLSGELAEKYDFLDTNLINFIIETKNDFVIESNNKWHRFSLKTMKELLPEMLETSKEQMTLLTERGMLKQNNNDYSGHNVIPVEAISEEIYNPVVKKAVRQSLHLFNYLMNKYEGIEYIVIEMPRDGNSDEQKRQIEKGQKINVTEKEQALAIFREKLGMSASQLEAKIKKERILNTKIRLWYQQEEKCLYSGKIIAPADLLANNYQFEIDHIIPQSVSFDDSLNNKVLCYAQMNQEKGKKTPYGFLRSGAGQGYDSFKASVKANKRLSKLKVSNLLFEENLLDIETRKRFVSRNLVDTRYASRVVLNELKQFIKSKNLPIKVTVVRGKYTHQLRVNWRVNKSRDTHHHHAVDATIIAASPLVKFWEKEASLIPIKVGENTIDIETGEILEEKDFEKEMYELPFEGFQKQLRDMEDSIKFSYQVDKKMNRKISDATVYSSREVISEKGTKEEYTIGTIKNIYSPDGYAAFKKKYNKDKNAFLMSSIDPKSFEKLEKIMDIYPDKEEDSKGKRIAVSPFELYRRENGYVTKYAKKNNGPAIKSLKFYNKKLGLSYIDISSNQVYKPKGKKVILQSLKSWRTDVYFNHETKLYEVMGIKYADLKYLKNGVYGISQERYNEIKELENVARHSEFYFSLYTNDRVKIINTTTDEKVELRFVSRTLPKEKGYVEFKPLTKEKFKEKEPVEVYNTANSSGRLVQKMAKEGYSLLKINTDIAGNLFYVKKEGITPKNIIDA